MGLKPCVEGFVSGSVFLKIHATLTEADSSGYLTTLLKKQSKDHNEQAVGLKSFLDSRVPSCILSSPSSAAGGSRRLALCKPTFHVEFPSQPHVPTRAFPGWSHLSID